MQDINENGNIKGEIENRKVILGTYLKRHHESAKSAADMSIKMWKNINFFYDFFQ